MEILNGKTILRVDNEGIATGIESADWRIRVQAFGFVGNQGNTGNNPLGMSEAPGGQGYEGMDGFSVIIVPAIREKK